MADLNASQLKVLLDVLGKANDHHDTSKPEVTHDLDALGNQAQHGIDLAALFAAAVKYGPAVVALFQMVRELQAAQSQKPPHQEPGATTPPKPEPPTSLPPNTGGASAVIPDEVSLALASVSGPRRVGAPTLKYHLAPGNVIVLEGGASSLDDGSILNFDGGLSFEGAGLRVDLDPAATPAGEKNHPELLGTIRYLAEDVATGELLGAIGGKGLAGDASTKENGYVDNGVSFVPNRYVETGGMAVAVKLSRQGGPVRIYAAHGPSESEGYVTPEIR